MPRPSLCCVLGTCVVLWSSLLAGEDEARSGGAAAKSGGAAAKSGGAAAKSGGAAARFTGKPWINPASLFEPYPKDHPEEAARDETLVRILEANPSTLNPIFMSSREDFYLVDLLFDSLFDPGADLSWRINTEMIESFEETPDHLRFLVRLKPGLKFHDGSPLTAYDVEFTWKAIMDPRVPALAIRGGRDQLAAVVAKDDRTVEFVHKEALATNPWNASFPILPRHLYDNPEERAKDPSLKQSDYYNRLNRQGAVGNGPLRLVEWSPNDRIVLERWEDFHGEKAHFRRQVLKVYKDRQTAFLSFARGEVDEIRLEVDQMVGPVQEEAFRQIGVAAVSSHWAYGYIVWNLDGSNPMFADVRVRRAIAHAVDVDRFIATQFHGLYARCLGTFHPDSWMFNPAVEPLRFELAEARRLLDEAGWARSDDDGWRYKVIGGKPVRLEFTVLAAKEGVEGQKAVAYMAEQLKRVGVQVRLQTLEWVTVQERLVKHEFQACASAWGAGADPDTSRNIWMSDQYAKGRNYGGYRNARVDELFDQGRREFDRERRAACYREIQKLIYEEQPYLFLYYRMTAWAFHKRLRGVVLSPSRGVFNFHPSYRGWWVRSGERLR